MAAKRSKLQRFKVHINGGYEFIITARSVANATKRALDQHKQWIEDDYKLLGIRTESWVIRIKQMDA